MAVCYAAGAGTSIDKAKAYKEYEEIVTDYSDTNCCVFRFSDVVPLDNDVMKDIYRNMAAMCFNGEGTPRNTSLAIKWLEKSADCGSVYSQIAIAKEYINGNNIPKDPSRGLAYLQKAVAADSAEAYFLLSVCYSEGWGVAPDIKKKLEYLKIAAQKGYGYAQNDLGVAYINGTGVPKDYKQALYWLKLASANGVKQADATIKQLNAAGIC